MKKKSDPRHQKRIAVVKKLFAAGFTSKLKVDLKDAKPIFAKKNEIDALIEKYAPAWPVDQLPPIDQAVLRLAIYELIFKKKKEPYKVIIDEAVEIAKEYGGDSSASFVNGVLGSLIKSKSKMKVN